MEQKTTTPGRITRQTTIGEAVRHHPEAAPVMANHGLHCVGCHVAHWETIEQGCRGHGMPEQQIDEMVDELNNLPEDDDEESTEEE